MALPYDPDEYDAHGNPIEGPGYLGTVADIGTFAPRLAARNMVAGVESIGDVLGTAGGAAYDVATTGKGIGEALGEVGGAIGRGVGRQTDAFGFTTEEERAANRTAPGRATIAAARGIDEKNRALASAIVGNSLANAGGVDQQHAQGLGGAGQRQLSVPRLGGYGLGGMQKDIRADRAAYGEGLEDYKKRQHAALEDQLKGEEASARAVQTQAERSAEALQEAEQAVVDQQATVGEIKERERAERQQWESKLDKAKQYATYFDLEPAKVDKLMEMRDAKDEAGRPLYSQEERNAAAAQLKQAQEVGDKRSVGTKIGAAIAMALGAFGQALAGGPNTAMEIINKQVDDDIRRQKELRGSKYGQLAEAKTDYGRAMQVYKDEEQAAAQAKLAQLERVERRLDVLGAKAQGDQAGANLQKMKGAIEAQKAELGQVLLDKEQQINAQSRQEERGIIGQRMQRDQANMALRNQAQALQARAGAGAGAGKQVAGGVAKEIGEYDAAKQQLEDWYSTTQKVGGSSTYAGALFEKGMSALPFTDEGEADAQKKAIAQSIGTILEGGKLTDPDFDKYMEMLPSVGDTASLAQKKRDTINKMLTLRQKGGLEALQKTGYNVDALLADIYSQEKAKPGKAVP